MISFEREIRELLGTGAVSEASARRAAALERGDLFSLYSELRFISYAAVLLVTTGAGILLKNNYARIGPDALIAIIGTAAAACYLWAASRRRQQKFAGLDDYILLLGALLLSADVAFIESRYRLLGDEWTAHLLIMAAVHAAAAYTFESRPLLSLSIASLAAWFGLERRGLADLDFGLATSSRAILCAAVILLWAAVDSKLNRDRRFEPVFAHALTNLAFWGVCGWVFVSSAHRFGFFFALAFAVLAVWYAFLRQRETFAIYGIGYGYIAVSVETLRFIGSLDETRVRLFFLWFIATIPLILLVLFTVHRRIRSLR